MSTITFQVNLGLPYAAQATLSGPNTLPSGKYGSYPDVASNQSSLAAARTAWIPMNEKKDNKQMHHGDVFTVSGPTAYYLKQHYTVGGQFASPEDSVLTILKETDGTWKVTPGQEASTNPTLVGATDATTVPLDQLPVNDVAFGHIHR
jgi:hypothetical protein